MPNTKRQTVNSKLASRRPDLEFSTRKDRGIALVPGKKKTGPGASAGPGAQECYCGSGYATPTPVLELATRPVPTVS